MSFVITHVQNNEIESECGKDPACVKPVELQTAMMRHFLKVLIISAEVLLCQTCPVRGFSLDFGAFRPL